MPRTGRGMLALVEVLGVFLTGTLAARHIARALDLGPANLRALEPGVTPDFVRLSGSAAAHLALRYGIILGLAYAIGRWHRGRRLAAYGVTRAGRPLRQHAALAVLLFAIGGLAPLLLKQVAQWFPLGPEPAHWAHLRSVDDPGVWLYLFVGSFGLVPIFEELLARGYVQTRLAEDAGVPAAIVTTAVLFTLAHTQYFLAGVLGVGMLVSLLFASLAAGYVREWTGSLLAAIGAHALGNLPFRNRGALIALAAMLVLLVVRREVLRPHATRFARMLRDARRGAAVALLATAAAAVALVLAMAAVARSMLPVVGGVLLGAALWGAYHERRVRRDGQHPGASGAPGS